MVRCRGAGRAQPFKNQAVPCNPEAGGLRHRRVVLRAVGNGGVRHLAASGAVQVVVLVLPQIVAVCAWQAGVGDLPLGGQLSQVAVYRAPADLPVRLAGIQENLVCGGVIGAGADGGKHQLALSGSTLSFHGRHSLTVLGLNPIIAVFPFHVKMKITVGTRSGIRPGDRRRYCQRQFAPGGPWPPRTGKPHEGSAGCFSRGAGALCRGWAVPH